MNLPTGLKGSSLGRRRLAGILCTYRRPDAVHLFLDRLAKQSLAPDLVVVVDNGNDSHLRSDLEGRSEPAIRVRYVSAGSNIGPAGAFELGLRELSTDIAPEDLVVLFDDDDPPVDPRQLAVLTAALDEAIRADPAVGGIGLSGGRLQERTGLVSSVVGREPIEEVDHLHGWSLPVYRARALLDVGGNDATFFFGFEELELGRRLHHRGWKLLVLNELMGQLVGLYPRRRPGFRAVATEHSSEDEWSRFHKERNLVRVLCREKLWLAVAGTFVGRHVLRPLVGLPKHPRVATRRIKLGVRATWAGLRGAGGIDPRYPPPGVPSARGANSGGTHDR